MYWLVVFQGVILGGRKRDHTVVVAVVAVVGGAEGVGQWMVAVVAGGLASWMGAKQWVAASVSHSGWCRESRQSTQSLDHY